MRGISFLMLLLFAACGSDHLDLEEQLTENDVIMSIEVSEMICWPELKQAWDFMLPAVEDKTQWSYPPDVQHFSDLPIQSPGMLFAARTYQDEEMVKIWTALDPARKSEEINRTYPIREPVLWQ